MRPKYSVLLRAGIPLILLSLGLLLFSPPEPDLHEYRYCVYGVNGVDWYGMMTSRTAQITPEVVVKLNESDQFD